MKKSKFYKELSVNGKINAKSWGFWRLPNKDGFMLTMIDNAESFKRTDYADFTKHHLCSYHEYAMPRNNVANNDTFNKLYSGLI